MKGFFMSALCLGPLYFSQQTQDSLKIRELEEVVFLKKTPVTKEIINVKKDLGAKNLGQDLPMLLNSQTSVVSTSDAGNGIGYSGMRIRGVDGSRINVMMNGVPYNDSESQGTYFVDVPDLASSASSIAIQRGVGTSSNGVSAFGASVNILTADPSQLPYIASQNSYGSFNTKKYSIEGGTGALLDGKLSFMGRYSMIKSDGYIERASSDLKSFNLTGLYHSGNTDIRLIAFGGKEKTYQAWNGISKEKMLQNRRFNSAGAIYNADWSSIVGYYDNETDNYTQNHYHLLWVQRFNDRVKLSTTIHYTDGSGYYENFKQDERFSKYGLPNLKIGNETIMRANFIRRKWLDNDFYGVISELNVKTNPAVFDFGVVANQYFGRHYGEIVRTQYDMDISKPHEYYRGNAVKNEMSAYAKAIVKFGQLEFFGDVQLRNIDYRAGTQFATPEEWVDFNNRYLFFNPKAGLSYNLAQSKWYLSYAQANREPKRGDIIASKNTLKQERLHDFELGYQNNFGSITFDINAYYMLYNDQLVLNGKLNDVGEALHENVKDSYRVGVELTATAKLSKYFRVFGNITYSDNRIKNYQYYNTFTKMTEQLGNTKIAFSPDLISSVTLQYQPSKSFQFSFASKYVGKQYLDNTQNEERRLDSFFVSDVITEYRLPFKKAEVALQLTVNNLFNKMYASNGYVYNDPAWVTIETPYYFPQAGTNFMLGTSIKF